MVGVGCKKVEVCLTKFPLLLDQKLGLWLLALSESFTRTQPVFFYLNFKLGDECLGQDLPHLENLLLLLYAQALLRDALLLLFLEILGELFEFGTCFLL